MLDQELIDRIKTAILKAERNKNKMVEIHYQILVNAEELNKLSGEDFCKVFNLSKGYQIEFKNMMKLAKRLKQ
ncbi:TPA: hypothetical protein ACK3JH_000954 [Mannheimia haemolytica]|nr:hypothetical protein [Lonepinella koalarum]